MAKTNTRQSESKASIIWSIADKIRGLYKPHEYGKVILPMTVIKWFSDTLAPTRKAVLEKDKWCKENKIEVKDTFLTKASKYNFYNTSPLSFNDLTSDAENIEANFRSYLNSFSANVSDILKNFKFDDQITTLADADKLFIVVQEFCSEKAYFGADKVSSIEMGYVFEHLIKMFSESYDEDAGAHFTARDIINLMTDILIAGDEEDLKGEVVTKTVYDMAMGTSQMLGCLSERIAEVNNKAEVICYGQEFNPETYAIAKSDMLIRGVDANNMKFGNTLDNDQFTGYTFDYIISNPPFGTDWKSEAKKVKEEHDKGENGRFGVGLPSVDDGQMLFVLNGVAKLKDNGRMVIIQNGSPLQGGDAGSGQSEIRKYLIERDWLEAIIQMPNDMFYNTGIATYIWVISKDKHINRRGRVQLINAKEVYEKRRKALGYKRNDFTEDCIKAITKAYINCLDGAETYYGKTVESKVIENDDFKYYKVVVETPLFENGKIVTDKKGKPVPDKTKKDTENIPAKVSFDEYMAKNVLPYNSHAYIDESKTKVGYEIPFTRLFYKYQAPREIKEIFNSIKELEKQETALMKELFANE